MFTGQDWDEKYHKPDDDNKYHDLKKALNSILQDAEGSKKTESANTSFLSSFQLCSTGIMTKWFFNYLL